MPQRFRSNSGITSRRMSGPLWTTTTAATGMPLVTGEPPPEHSNRVSRFRRGSLCRNIVEASSNVDLNRHDGSADATDEQQGRGDTNSVSSRRRSLPDGAQGSPAFRRRLHLLQSSSQQSAINHQGAPGTTTATATAINTQPPPPQTSTQAQDISQTSMVDFDHHYSKIS